MNSKKIVSVNFKKGDKLTNLFENCALLDPFMEDIDAIKSFLEELQPIYEGLSSENKQKPIYLNFGAFDKCGYASFKKEYLILSEPINKFLSFKNDKELDWFAQELYDIRQNDEMDDTKKRCFN